MRAVVVEASAWEEAWLRFKADLFRGYTLCNVQGLSELRRVELERRIESLKAELEKV